MIVVRRGRWRDDSPRKSEFDELLRALMAPVGTVSRRSGGTWRPPVDVYEEADRIMVVAEIAGMNREEIEISLDGDLVWIRGNRPHPAGSEQRSFHEARIAFGGFEAEVRVPFAVDSDRATATYENGFLTIELPRVQGRTIVATSPHLDSLAGRNDA
jgi:HSP20 family protein